MMKAEKVSGTLNISFTVDCTTYAVEKAFLNNLKNK
jgi:hypothetical protein